MLDEGPELHAHLFLADGAVAQGVGPVEQMLLEGHDHGLTPDFQGHQRLGGSGNEGDAAFADQQVKLRILPLGQGQEVVVFVLIHQPQNVFQVEAVGLRGVVGLAAAAPV